MKRTPTIAAATLAAAVILSGCVSTGGKPTAQATARSTSAVNETTPSTTAPPTTHASTTHAPAATTRPTRAYTTPPATRTVAAATIDPRVTAAQTACQKADVTLGQLVSRADFLPYVNSTGRALRSTYDGLGGTDAAGDVAVDGSLVNLDLSLFGPSALFGTPPDKQDVDRFVADVHKLVRSCAAVGYETQKIQ